MSGLLLHDRACDVTSRPPASSLGVVEGSEAQPNPPAGDRGPSGDSTPGTRCAAKRVPNPVSSVLS